MGRQRVPGSEGRDSGGRHGEGKAPSRRSAPGLRVVARDGTWHLSGTVRAGGRRQRIRESTGLPARPEHWEEADRLRQLAEARFYREAVHGERPLLAVALAVAADRYLNAPPGDPLHCPKRPKARTREAVRRVTRHLGRAVLAELGAERWGQLLDTLFAGRAATTRERFITALTPFFEYCTGHRMLPAPPEIERPALPSRRRHAARRRVAELRPDLILFLIERAPVHLEAQLWAEWSTGARVSSVLFGCRVADVHLAPGRERITFHDTKNGDPVVAALHPAAAAALRDYAEWRGRLHRREDPFFLTDRRRPYSTKGREGGWGGQNRSAMKGAVRRAVVDLAAIARARGRAGDWPAAWSALADARLLRQVTQHWLRHWFATHALAGGMDLRSIMDQGGWRSLQAVQAYQHDVPEVRRRALLALPIGAAGTTPLDTSLTRSSDAGAGTPRKA